MQFTLREIVSLTSATYLGSEQLATKVVDFFCTDSREVRNTGSSLFVALKTDVRDGHQFIASAFQKGVRAFLISDASLDVSIYEGAIFLVVEDTLQAMQQIAAGHRNRFDIPIVGITGSNGKTIVKEWLAKILAQRFEVIKNPKSFNSQVGVPLSIDLITPIHEIGVFEAGISLPGEMQSLQQIIQPSAGIFTMIGAAHGAHFESDEQKVQEKLKLFTSCDKIYYCLDHELVHQELIEFVNKQEGKKQLICWGHAQGADLKIKKQNKTGVETNIHFTFQEKDYEWTIPYTDDAYIENAMHCLLYLLDSGFTMEQLGTSFMQLPPVQMRLELLKGIQDCTLVNDTYSIDIASLRIALDLLYEQKQHTKYSIILSDILQHKGKEPLYKALQSLLQHRSIDKLILIGEQGAQQKELFEQLANRFYTFPNVQMFLQQFDVSQFQQEAILIKGARQFALERIVNRLENTIHRTVMNINLTALLHNIKAFKKQLKPKTKIMAMVKAFSYGSGSYEIAQTLEHYGVDYLAVAYVDEGIALRRKGIKLPILVLNPEVASLDAMLHYELEPEIYSIAMLKQFVSRIEGLNRKLPIHIKLDTGMHRLGIESKDLSDFIKELQQATGLRVQSVFSHLVASDDQAQDDFTQHQQELFESMASQIETALGYSVIKHLANSAGAIRKPNLQYDMVRLGLGLYGITGDATMQRKLLQVSALKTRVSQIKEIPTSDTVGYARAGKLQRDSKIATLNIGYADGYSRSFGNGKGKVLINGKLAPVVGNVCMDMIMVDVTDIQQVKAGQEAIIFDQDLPVSQLADWIDTIPYEIISGISQRVKRVYYLE